MKRSIKARLLSFLLVLALLIGCCPAAWAAEAEEPETTETVTEALEEVGQATEESAAATEETTQVAETDGETAEPVAEPTETTTVPSEMEETAAETTEGTDETTAAAETEAELPHGFLGLPEGYALTQEQMQEKQDMADHAVAEGLENLSAGNDYADDVVMFAADSEEEALVYAQAYNAELISFSYGIGTIRLVEASVAQAVEAAQDMELPLPAVWPDYITHLEPVEVTSGEADGGLSLMEVPERQDWNSWVNSALSNPDPALRNPGGSIYQYHHDVIDSYAAWGVSTGRNVTVAVISSGVNGSNPDLSGKVRHVTVDSSMETTDEDGYGTHAAGIIAATMNNAFGGAGVAPDASILSIRVNTGNAFNVSYTIRGINAAVQYGVDVIYLGVAGSWYSGVYQDAIDNALANNVAVVAAMGDRGHNGKSYPAACDGVIGVIASDRTNSRAPYSQYGDWGDIAAPGTDIQAAYNNSADYPGNFGPMSGTSRAAAVVSGVLALYKSVYPWATPAQMESRMKATATKVGGDLKCGIINAAAMLSEKPGVPYADTNSSYYDSGDFKSGIPCNVKLVLYPTNADRTAYILYTLDGKSPSVKNGTVITGTEYTGGIDLSSYAGQTITLKAAQVNGMGMMGAVVTHKIKVDRAGTVTGIALDGPATLVAGKKGEFTVAVQPVSTADQSVIWEVVSNTARGAVFDRKTGTLTTIKGGTGCVVLRVHSAVSYERFAEITVDIVDQPPVAKISMPYAKTYLFVGEEEELEVNAVDAKGEEAETDILWRSSNTDVAEVDAGGNVTAVGKGSAVITAKALDGSGKSTKCTVVVLQKVEKIEITGQHYVAPGTAAAFKATVSPQDASYKAVTWLVSGPEGVSVNAKSGKLTVSPTVPIGTSFWVVARSQDGYPYCMTYYEVEVRERCTGVAISVNSDTGRAPGASYNKKGVLTEVGLFSVNRANGSGENQVILEADCENPGCVQWSSSNPSVASVDDSGNVTAFKAGTAKITATANDGSKKKAAVTIKVTNPASSIALNSNGVKGGSGMDYIGIGKSLTLTPVFAAAYGVPSNQKVTWSWSAKYYDNDSWYNASGMLAGSVSCTNGKLAVKATDAVKDLEENFDVRITVTATAADGTGTYARREFKVVTLASQIGIDHISSRQSDGSYILYFYSDQQDYNAPEFAITTSKPDCVNIGEVFETSDTIFKNGRTCWIYGVQLRAGDRGTANIVIKTTDGSNKSATYKLKVN